MFVQTESNDLTFSQAIIGCFEHIGEYKGITRLVKYIVKKYVMLNQQARKNE